MSLQTKAVFEFGPFRLDPAERLLYRGHALVRLPPKAFDALVVLVEKRGHLLEKEVLLREVWPDTFVEESNLTQHISMLRKALQEGEGGSRYIETVPTRGYRFVAEVREFACASEPGILTDGTSGRTSSGESDGDVKPIHQHRFLRLTYAVGALTLSLAAAILALPAWNRLHNAAPKTIQSLAVLPLQNLSGDPAQDYFADGMTEALITDMAKTSGLKVISRTSIMQYKDSRKKLPEIAQELGVDAIVEGSVLRSADRVRVTAQLVQGATDQHLWAETYERDLRDSVTLQDDVSRNIAMQIRKEIAPSSPRQLAALTAVTPQARDDYLKGRYFWNQRSEASYLKSIEYFQAAIAENPQYAEAYAGLADAYALLGSLPNSKTRQTAMPEAKETAMKALELDDSLAEAHTSLAFVEMHYDWKFEEAEQEFKRAIDLNPNYAIAYQWYALDLAALGRIDEAVTELKVAQQTDPLSAIINTDLAEMLYFERRYDDALLQARATIEMNPNFAHAHRILALIYDEKHQFPQAIAENKQAVELIGDDVWMWSDLATTYYLAGKKAEMHDCLKKVTDIVAAGTVPETHGSAELYALMGKPDQAFKVLQSQYEHRNGGLLLINYNPPFDSLKTDPRFRQLTQRIGLPH
jgi:TolB-like protein/DNA-binding winged helix-turn-helix (wHTH) protein/Flp pilus assembly protein TadD